ncbi:uncharacterized protein GGS25DRAFT_525392 [Hypoxylon fragiforme]|uniref:uncharacterized protein n=1 Tax=Hypoxylon fragiforme TaxID=63214 RepID=UPI0020C5CABC|nr:uncharacterized protein GGS25DRAFT_525392 [Hypoxylon fragiforme]KAI2604113.1 hypothetical protein GGS25DRAFT_525392 [Hypoxylon fragiforme]
MPGALSFSKQSASENPLLENPVALFNSKKNNYVEEENVHPPKPSRSLAGKVAIVTGAGCEGDGLGNGRAISMLLAEDGAAVVCADLNLAWAEHVTKPTDCQKIVDAAMSRFGRIDILVNNVGVLGAKGDATAFGLDQWRRGLDINVTSMANMVKVGVPEMRKNDESFGHIRGAVLNMTRAIAAHHASDGIRVNCVCPGMLYTPMMYTKGTSPETRNAGKNRSLLRTEGNAWDCATAVRFLVSEQSRWITGGILTVDAGATAVSALDLKREWLTEIVPNLSSSLRASSSLLASLLLFALYILWARHLRTTTAASHPIMPLSIFRPPPSPRG